ncbi:Hsp20/alpha crystallin family protein [Sulfurimonas autotrophica]|uniref:Heat shock protein Hsp20 n=1 Tax=Sulfurimonas autotrophica (strain ATCC BAA-671 / DSM 16294 / JCM 11897 / OK10) TaxID=563040 RepID=E0UTR2_SULAO|nr:Hsp20/alpha crystallin family protein [Sulfurimonas autotrophica]ADN08293.1 heat shock protein Hsp20 [Sulfurimonas autotrophica DSM 16294]
MLVTRHRNPTNTNNTKRFDLINEFFNALETQNSEEPREVFDFIPAVNTRESDDAYYIELDLPGIKKEDVEISIDKNILTIKGKREVKREEKKDDYYRVESAYGTFARSFTLPEKVDTENIRASSEDGVVEITIPKLKVEKDTTKKIEIE